MKKNVVSILYVFIEQLYQSDSADLITVRNIVGDALNIHNLQMFTTIDRDNDNSNNNCADRYTGAWWYNNCHQANLNGKYFEGGTAVYGEGINWFQWRGYDYSLKTVKMMIRKIDGWA